MMSERSEGCSAWLGELHRKSVEHHRQLIEGATGGEKAPGEVVGDYFEALEVFLREGEFAGCPFTNAAAALEEQVNDEEAEAVRAEVEAHKMSIRDFFVAVAEMVDDSAGRARHLGEALFLMYSGATTEAKNLRETWPVARARSAALQMIEAERSRGVVGEEGR